MTKKMMGHNQPPLTIEDFHIKDPDGNSIGRIKLTNTILKKYLVRRYDKEKDKYLDKTINDSEKIGLKVKINPGGSKSFYYKHDPKGKTATGKRRNPIWYHLGHFPEMRIDAARSLVEDLKQAIKLGHDPKTVLTVTAEVALIKSVTPMIQGPWKLDP